MRAVIQRQRFDELDRDITHAWHVVAIWVQSHKPKGALKVPDLKGLLAKRDQKPKTLEGHRQMLAALSQHLGVPMRKVKKAKKKRS